MEPGDTYDRIRLQWVQQGRAPGYFPGEDLVRDRHRSAEEAVRVMEYSTLLSQVTGSGVSFLRRHRSRIHVALHPSYGHPRESPLLAPAQLGQVALFVLGRLSAVSPRFSKHPLTCGTAAYPGAMSTKRL